jgi:hypothetical protein
MSILSIQTQTERLDHNMRVSQSNHDVIELVMVKDNLPTLNTALSKIISSYRTSLRGSSMAVKKVSRNKKSDDEVQIHQHTRTELLDNNEYEERIKKGY